MGKNPFDLLKGLSPASIQSVRSWGIARRTIRSPIQSLLVIGDHSRWSATFLAPAYEFAGRRFWVNPQSASAPPPTVRHIRSSSSWGKLKPFSCMCPNSPWPSILCIPPCVCPSLSVSLQYFFYKMDDILVNLMTAKIYPRLWHCCFVDCSSWFWLGL